MNITFLRKIDIFIVLLAFELSNISGWKEDLIKGYGITLLIKQLAEATFPWFLKN